MVAGADVLVGVLALQGDFEAHAKILRALGAGVREVRTPADLEGLDGLIMLDRDHLGVMDIRAERNAFGRQVRSFEADLDFPGVEGGPVRAVFIRAPWIADAGSDVAILAEVDGHPVAAEEGNVTVVSFHPEISGEDRLHRRFLERVRERRAAAPANR